jgi:predicted alpha/beta hydrolase family esterase
MQFVRAISFLFMLALTGCISGIKYGDVPHAQFVSDPRCGGAPDPASEALDLPLFAVTSRLPDCRGQALSLTDFRSDQTRYLRFAKPEKYPAVKGKQLTRTQMSIKPADKWWADLAKQADAHNGRVLIYVHGFRETFNSSSRDTAQIARLTEFKGPVIQYSWPSQGELLSYVVDETNMYWDERNFRTFLQSLAEKPWVKDIVIVSHSLGARLVVPSIEYVDRTSANQDSSNISNILLIAPDTDTQEFEREIGLSLLSPARVASGRKLTLFVSAKDKAIALSRTIHGYPRLGNPFCFNPFTAAALKAKGLPERCYAEDFRNPAFLEKSALQIIDTTDVVASSGSGHSDYLRSAAACRVFANIANGRANSGLAKTRLSYVAAIAPYTKGEKPAHDVICMREAE